MPITKVSAGVSAWTHEPALALFWERIPKFFLWPMQFDPLTVIGMGAAGAIVASILPFIGGLLALVIWFYFFRYAMNVWMQTARGNFNPAAADLVQESGDRRRTPQLITWLLAADQGAAALEVLQHTRGIDKNVIVPDASAALALAKAAKAKCNVPWAMEMNTEG